MRETLIFWMTMVMFFGGIIQVVLAGKMLVQFIK